MNRVDPNLFSTCRLCLEELGDYQIIPSIQEQIKSCYDIVVDAFDGLPQLICQQCETNLRNHFATKQQYLEKQNLLKQRINTQKVIDEDRNQLPTLQPEHEVEQERVKRRKLSSATESSISTHADHSYTSSSWASNYFKTYCCRICMYRGKKQKYMEYHNGTRHKTMRACYSDVLNQYCYVKLDKIDNKPNITGCKDTVVINSKKIIVSNSDYVIHYTPRRRISSTEGSDNETILTTEILPSKRKRILSSTSGDTVVIDNSLDGVVKQEKGNNANDWIQISSDESENSNDQKETESNKSIAPCDNDFRTIDNISSKCFTKYLESVENMKKVKLSVLSSSSESQLNSKVLSIGRKVLNGNNLNCMGLLRFLEQKNLPVLWLPANNATRDSNIVIKTCSKNLSLEISSDDSNWTFQTKTRSAMPPKQVTTTSDLLFPIKTTNHQDLRSLLTRQFAKPILIKTIVSSSTDTKGKILNASPVANPKQMPTKVRSDTKPDISVDNEENAFSLPMITSTMSLVPLNENGSTESPRTASKGVPRYIKVKSASELMTKEALNNLRNQEAPPFTYADISRGASLAAPLAESGKINEKCNENIPAGLPCGSPIASQTAGNNFPEINSTITNHPNNGASDKYVILDTVLLPNTKTNSPFQYLKNLLVFHNLILVDKDEGMPAKFCSLIKFKVSFKQDTTEPVIFGMQLYYYNRSFCIKVKDKNQSDIPIMSLSAEWQWEMIKTLKGDVIEKILANAKKVSKDAHSDTKNFIHLLNSIRYKKVD